MKVTVDMDEGLVAAVEHVVKVQNISREAAFREALQTWVAQFAVYRMWLLDFRVYRRPWFAFLQ
jgi:Ribbon-helix-helix protein, copG family